MWSNFWTAAICICSVKITHIGDDWRWFGNCNTHSLAVTSAMPHSLGNTTGSWGRFLFNLLVIKWWVSDEWWWWVSSPRPGCCWAHGAGEGQEVPGSVSCRSDVLQNWRMRWPLSAIAQFSHSWWHVVICLLCVPWPSGIKQHAWVLWGFCYIASFPFGN